MAGWAFILYEVFAIEAGNVANTSDNINANVRQSFQTMRIICGSGGKKIRIRQATVKESDSWAKGIWLQPRCDTL